MSDVVEFPPRDAELAEVAEMRAGWLKVRDDSQAMQRVGMLAERVADIIGQIKITDADRQSLLWHLSLIRELACGRGPVPLCSFPRLRKDPPDAS